MPQFVILEHHHEGIHWDFMLESGPVLRTWRLATRPDGAYPIVATELPGHRRKYLHYEGDISGGRGSVTRWDWGEFDWISVEPASVEVRIEGRRLAGRVYLLRDDSGGWTFRVTPSEEESAESAVR